VTDSSAIDFGLKDRVVVVTGGTRGIGAAIVELLYSIGTQVISISRNEVEKNHIDHVKADVTDANQMREAFETIEQEHGSIYGVVANAGITNDSLFAKSSESAWAQVIDTNLNGVFNSIHPIVPKLFDRRSGSVVLISSIIGERGGIGQANYSASKAALIGLAKSLAREGARYNVRFNAVAPGFVETDMVRSIPDSVRERLIAEVPMRRFATPTEIAWAVAFLLSPVASSYITGEVLRVNGAHHT
jgi:acetoacetyl-CoA reductase